MEKKILGRGGRNPRKELPHKRRETKRLKNREFVLVSRHWNGGRWLLAVNDLTSLETVEAGVNYSGQTLLAEKKDARGQEPELSETTREEGKRGWSKYRLGAQGKAYRDTNYDRSQQSLALRQKRERPKAGGGLIWAIRKDKRTPHKKEDLWFLEKPARNEKSERTSPLTGN